MKKFINIKRQDKKEVVNEKLKSVLTHIIYVEIRPDARDEAMEILLKSDSAIIGEFLYYHYSGVNNIPCMVLDKAKSILVKSGKMTHSETDSFGRPFI